VQALPVQDDLARGLALAADTFVVRRGPQQRTVIAGYPGSVARTPVARGFTPASELETGNWQTGN